MSLAPIHVEGTWYRCLSRKREPLSTRGALLNAGRYNTIGSPVLYLAGSPNLAVSEHLGLGELYGVARFPPRLLVSVDVTLRVVLNLTDPEVLERLEVTPAQLLLPYSEDPERPSATQQIAQQAKTRGFEGILAPSSLDDRETNLIVFPENVATPESVRVVGFDDHVDEEHSEVTS